jgi:hypothetical protein
MFALAIDLETTSTTPGQTLIAVVLLGALVATLLYGVYRLQYVGLPAPLDRQKGDLRGAKAEATVRSYRFPGDTNWQAERTRRRLRRLFDPDAAIEQVTVRDAGNEIRRALTEQWAPVLLRVPPFARRLLSLAATILVFGTLALATEQLRALLTFGGGGLQLHLWPQVAIEQTAAVLAAAASVLGAVPGVGVLTGLVVSLVVLVGQALYEHWYVTGALLALAALVSAYLDHRVSDAALNPSTDPLPPTRRVGRVAIGGVLAVWLATLLGIGIGRTVGSAGLGVELGLAAGTLGTLVLVALAGRAVWRLGGRLRGALRRRSRDPDLSLLALEAIESQRPPDRRDEWPVEKAHALAQALDEEAPGWDGSLRTRAARAYLVARAVSLAVAVLVAPFVPVYVVLGLAQLPSLLGAYAAAALPVQVVVAAGLFAVAGGLGYQARAAWPEVRDVLVDVVGRGRVRAVAVGAGLPVAALVGSYLAVYGIVRSVVVAGLIAVVVALALRLVTRLVLRARYHAGRVSESVQAASHVVVEAAVLEDSDGREHYYARVNGREELLHPEREGCVDAVVTVADRLTTDGEVEPTVAALHADYAFDAGVVDVEETVRKGLERARKRLYHELRDGNRRVERERVEREVGDLPEELWSRRLQREKELGHVVERGGHLVLRHDPYKSR